MRFVRLGLPDMSQYRCPGVRLRPFLVGRNKSGCDAAGNSNSRGLWTRACTKARYRCPYRV